MGVALFVLHHLLGKYHWRDILDRVQAISNTKLLRAAFFTCAGYGCLTLYDALAVRFAGARVPYPRVALISFMGYAIGHNVGLNSISGGAVRYRAYTALGLSAKQIATIIAFGTLTFFLGASVLLGVSLLLNAEMSGSMLQVPDWLALVAGVALLAGVGAYFWLVCTRHAPLRFRHLEIPVPKPRVAFAQIGISCVDMLCASSVLYVLLPREAAISFAAFAAVYLLALAAGAISNVPGGIGVFEFVLLLLMPAVPKDRLLGALIAYRAIYYFAPFAIALVLLGAHEIWIHRAPVVRFARLARTFSERGDAAGDRHRGISGRRRAAVFRSHARPWQSHRAAAQCRALAGVGTVASARQRGGRRPAHHRPRPVPAPGHGVVD